MIQNDRQYESAVRASRAFYAAVDALIEDQTWSADPYGREVVLKEMRTQHNVLREDMVAYEERQRETPVRSVRGGRGG